MDLQLQINKSIQNNAYSNSTSQIGVMNKLWKRKQITHIDLANPRIASALHFIANTILGTITNPHVQNDFLYSAASKSVFKQISSLSTHQLKIQLILETPWILFSPANDQEELDENISIYNRISNDPRHIEFYTWYHNCDTVAILLWAVAVEQFGGFNYIVDDKTNYHVYVIHCPSNMINSNCELVETLWLCAQVKLKTPIRFTIFSNPLDHYVSHNISPDRIEDWQKEDMILLAKMGQGLENVFESGIHPVSTKLLSK